MIENLSRRVKKRINISTTGNNLPVIICAASLAHHRLLGSVKKMELANVDLSSVPAEQLASLASSVTESVEISNAIGCDWVTFLDSVKSEKLIISKESLGSKETEALVRAMESRVEVLYCNVTLKISILMEYSGQGKCKQVKCFKAASLYREQLRTWARERNWRVTRKDDFTFSIIKEGVQEVPVLYEEELDW